MKRCYKTKLLVHFDRLVLPESVQNNRQLFFEMLDTIEQHIDLCKLFKYNEINKF